jgi:hypothetical protein
MTIMLEKVTDRNWKEFIDCPMAVLIVTETECPHCKAWKEELSRFLEEGRYKGKVRFGVVILDGEGVDEFKAANDAWLQIIDGYPFNAIYVDGEPQNSFYGAGVKRMVKRLDRLDP